MVEDPPSAMTSGRALPIASSNHCHRNFTATVAKHR